MRQLNQEFRTSFSGGGNGGHQGLDRWAATGQKDTHPVEQVGVTLRKIVLPNIFCNQKT